MTQYNTEEKHTAFCLALAAAQREIENIGKTSINPHFKSRYADLASIREGIHEIIGKHGLWIKFRLTTENGWLASGMTVGHQDGYEDEETVLRLPVGQATSQAFGSASTYARRYQTSAYFNLASEDEDDDGNAATASANGKGTAPGAIGPVSPAQAEEIRQAIVEIAADLPRFLKAFGIDRIEEMPAGRFAEAMHKLNLKRQQSIARDFERPDEAPDA